MQKINYIVALVLVIFYFINITPILNHANMFHLFANTYCLLICVNDRIINKWLVYPIIVACGLVAMIHSNAVGFSSAIFAMIGVNYIDKPTLFNTDLVTAMFLISAFVPQLAFCVHLISFVLGCIVGAMCILYNHYTECYGYK